MDAAGPYHRALGIFIMQVVLLGTAAGGGFPQWNCWCPSCRVARADPRQAIPRTQSSAAVSADGERWFLLNASPDVREQLVHLGEPYGSGLRRSAIAGVVLTDAELDHTLGIALLRECRRLDLYATCAAQTVLERDSRLLPVTRAFADVSATELLLGRATPLRYTDGELSSLAVEAFAVAGDPPRFARDSIAGHTVGLAITDQTTGGRLAFVPGCAELDDKLASRLADSDLLLFDGTFWSDEELLRLGISTRRAREMDHLPISGADGSLERLAQLAVDRNVRTVYTHINNTNPVLLESSAERRTVVRCGATVGQDGMTFTL